MPGADNPYRGIERAGRLDAENDADFHADPPRRP